MDASTSHYLRLLSIFHYVLAGLGALFSLVPALYIVMGVAMVSGVFDGNGTKPSPPSPPPAAFGWVFVAIGAILMLMGLAYVVLVTLAGRFLARARHWSFCIVVAALSCVFFPFGTVLGVFTIIVLSKPDVKAVFEAGPAASAGAPPAERPA